jgi:hypothetical protein
MIFRREAAVKSGFGVSRNFLEKVPPDGVYARTNLQL